MATAPKLVLSLKLKNILFATDFSPCSELALPYARALATRFGSTVHLLHVLPPGPDMPVPMDYTPDLDAPLREAEEHMARMLLRQSLGSIDHEILIERGPLWHVVQETVEEKNIDLIVLGTHGRRGLKKLVLGSVAEEIFRRAHCPVLTIGPHTSPDGSSEVMFPSVLYATDFSNGAMPALPYAIGVARQNHARLTLLHVLPDMPEIPPAELEQITESCRERLLGLLSPGVGLDCRPEAIVVFGTAADGILRIAREQHARLVVMGARRPSLGMATVHLPWATAHRVVCEAACPVLTVRA